MTIPVLADLFTAYPVLLIIAGGFGVGFLVGITGVGAGSLMTPFLISTIGVPPVVAVGTDLLFASITKASAAFRHHKLGNVDLSIFGWLAAGSLPGAAMMLGALYLLKPDTEAVASLIRHVLAVALIISAAAIALYPLLRRTNGAQFTAVSADSVVSAARPAPTLILGLILGALVALTSVGAGAIGVVVLTLLYPAILARRIIGTDIVHAIPLTFLAGASHFGMGHVDLKLLGMLLIGSVPGILLGSRITRLVPDWMLRIFLAVILSYAAYQLWLKP
jgi:uncharacterized protein